MTPREFTDDDVKAFIERASALADRSADRLSVDDLQRIGADLGFSDATVAGALDALERDRARAAAAQAQRVALKKRNLRVAAAFVALASAALGVVFVHAGSLRSRADVERAGIVSALDRQRQVEQHFTTGTREGDAEIAGAINRVGIARMRYDEAAVAYNASLGRSLFGLERMPPSADVGGPR